MKLVSNFHHVAGNHCGSTSMRDLLGHLGIDLSEAMCFGLGSGLGFFYHRDPHDTSPTHFFHGRTATLERDLCIHLGLDFEEGADDDADHAAGVVKEFIDADIPVMLNVELSQLPYYHSRTPFPGHRVVLAGYDGAGDVVLIADNGFSKLQEISDAALRAARMAPVSSGLFPLRNDWLVVKSTPARVPLNQAIRDALRDNARGMNLDRLSLQAIMGMETLSEDFENWDNSPDWEWCARFCYQLIEKRGTGGGLFRKMYAQFLREAETLDAQLREARLSETMAQIADEWTAFALLLKRISEEKERALFFDASNAIRRLAMREENFWGRVLDLNNE